MSRRRLRHGRRRAAAGSHRRRPVCPARRCVLMRAKILFGRAEVKNKRFCGLLWPKLEMTGVAKQRNQDTSFNRAAGEKVTCAERNDTLNYRFEAIDRHVAGDSCSAAWESPVSRVDQRIEGVRSWVCASSSCDRIPQDMDRVPITTRR